MTARRGDPSCSQRQGRCGRRLAAIRGSVAVRIASLIASASAPALGQHANGEPAAPSLDAPVAHADAATRSNAGAAADLAQPGRSVDANGDGERLDRARELFWRAYQDYTHDRYDQAVDLFEESYQVYPQAEVLFNIALANAKKGDCEVARARAAEYTAQAAAGDDDAQVATLRERIGQTCGFDAATAAMLVSPSAGPPASSEPEPAGPVAAVAVAEQQNVVEATALAASPAGSSTIADHGGRESYWTPRRKLAWGLLGGAAVTGGFTVYFAHELTQLDAASDEVMDEVHKDEESTNAGDQLHQHEVQRQRDIWLMSATAALTVGFSVAGIVLLNTEPSISAQVRLAGKDFAQLSLSGQF